MSIDEAIKKWERTNEIKIVREVRLVFDPVSITTPNDYRIMCHNILIATPECETNVTGMNNLIKKLGSYETQNIKYETKRAKMRGQDELSVGHVRALEEIGYLTERTPSRKKIKLFRSATIYLFPTLNTAHKAEIIKENALVIDYINYKPLEKK